MSVIIADISSWKVTLSHKLGCDCPDLLWLSDHGPHGEGPGVVFVAHGGVLHLVIEELVGGTNVLRQALILGEGLNKNWKIELRFSPFPFYFKF